jgi:hypothetical protein
MKNPVTLSGIETAIFRLKHKAKPTAPMRAQINYFNLLGVVTILQCPQHSLVDILSEKQINI